MFLVISVVEYERTRLKESKKETQLRLSLMNDKKEEKDISEESITRHDHHPDSSSSWIQLPYRPPATAILCCTEFVGLSYGIDARSKGTRYTSTSQSTIAVLLL